MSWFPPSSLYFFVFVNFFVWNIRLTWTTYTFRFYDICLRGRMVRRFLAHWRTYVQTHFLKPIFRTKETSKHANQVKTRYWNFWPNTMPPLLSVRELEHGAGTLRSRVFSGAGARALKFPMLQGSFCFLILI